jgi:DNA end-binding protein Ku
MARTLWSGSISLGLVNVPVKVQGAITDKDVRFHLLHARDGARVRFKRVCAKDGDELEQDQIVRGYEISRGQYVTFTDAELENVDAKAARTIDILHFVSGAEIDPAYYDKPHYLVPDKNAQKAYGLLLAALQKTKKVGIARMVMREKEHLVALRAKDGVLMMETMHFNDEVVPSEAVASEVAASPSDLDKRQLDLAQQIIDKMTVDFDPTQYENRHRDRLLALIDQKAAGKEVVLEPETAPGARAVDLLTALETSLAQARQKAKAAA